jgi:hypothetical protein
MCGGIPGTVLPVPERAADALFELTDALLCTTAGQDAGRAGPSHRNIAVDVSPWPRPDGACSPQRSFCHTNGRGRAAC